MAADGNVSSVATCSSSSPYETSSPYQTAYSYDSLGELVTQTAADTAAAPSGQVTNYTYDPAGNELTLENPDGATATNTFTPLNQLASVTYSAGTHTATYNYDADGNQTGMFDASGISSSSFDPFDELTSTTNGAGQTTSYAYDLDGNLTGISYPLGSGATWASTDTVTYTYDHADQLASVTDFNGHTSNVSMSADGLPTAFTLGASGDTVSTSYASNDTPSSITLSNGSTLQEFAYSDSPSGEFLSETDTPSSALSPADYVFDAQGQVTSDTPGSGGAKSYAEDASGNLSTTPTGATGTYDDASELTSSALSGTTTSYTYDASGNRVGASVAGSATVTATYNGASELASYDNAAANMSNATYDGDGLRTSETTGSTTQHFVWNEITSVPELLMDSTNAYIYGPSGTPFEQISLSGGTIHYVDCDALGSVRGVVSSGGSLTASTSYDAWGNPETTGGLTSYTPLGFAGGYTDATNLVYLINRYFDPTTGSFTNVDPDIAETDQAYAYAGDDPVDSSDPLGLCNSGVENGYYPGKCATNGPEAMAAGQYIASHASAGGFSITNGFEAVADYGAGIANFAVSTATLGHDHVSSPYCGFNWASDVGFGYGFLATVILSGGVGVGADTGATSEVAEAAEAESADAAAEEAPQYVYRVHGGDSGPWGQSWTTDNPLEMDNPRSELGLPKGNSGEFLSKASVLDSTGAITRDALAGDGGPGGAPEILFPNPAAQLQNLWTIALNPPF